MRKFSTKTHITRLCLLLLLNSSCASSTGIFPAIVTSLSESELVLPNPISIAVDAANSQIVVANSNVDIFYETGSLSSFSVNATNTGAPELTALHVLETPNFAGQIHFDAATNNLYLPFRESHPSDDSFDQVEQYTLSAAGQLALVTNNTVSANPFGITGNAANLFVISDDTLSIFDTALSLQSRVDLSSAEGTIDDSLAEFVETAAYDATGNRLFVGNPGGNLFIVDLATNVLSQVLVGPTSTRSVIISNDVLYALDPVEKSVWIFDLTQLPAPASTPITVDDSTFLVTTVSVGNNPNGMAIDAANNRLYVANTDDNTISVIDTLTFTELARVSVALEDISTTFLRELDQPFGLALGTFNATTYLFITGFNSNAIGMLNTSTLRIVEIYPNSTL